MKKTVIKSCYTFVFVAFKQKQKKEKEENHFIFHCVSCRYLIPAILNVNVSTFRYYLYHIYVQIYLEEKQGSIS